jgi:hypothetical protein
MMGFLLAVIAVIIIIVTGGNHPSNVAKPKVPEPAAVVRPAPVEPPLQQATPEIPDDKAMSANELDEQHAALDADEMEQKAPTGPNPCVGQDGGMIPDCAVIARKTGDYEISKQIHVISDWVHVWTR